MCIRDRAQRREVEVAVGGVDVTGVGDDGVDLRDCDATLARVSIVGNGGFGVRAQRGGLEIRSSNLQRNAAGGLRSQPVDTLVVTGTVFARNGRAPVGMVGGSSVGGAELLASQSVRFEGNTVADNQSTSAAQRAIVCDDRGGERTRRVEGADAGVDDGEIGCHGSSWGCAWRHRSDGQTVQATVVSRLLTDSAPADTVRRTSETGRGR